MDRARAKFLGDRLFHGISDRIDHVRHPSSRALSHCSVREVHGRRMAHGAESKPS